MDKEGLDQNYLLGWSSYQEGSFHSALGFFKRASENPAFENLARRMIQALETIQELEKDIPLYVPVTGPWTHS
jgi:hypothetical protein